MYFSFSFIVFFFRLKKNILLGENMLKGEKKKEKYIEEGEEKGENVNKKRKDKGKIEK